MAGALLYADDIKAVIDAEIIVRGAKAFAHNGHAHLYSGPRNSVLSQILDFKYTNHEYARLLAKRSGAVLIEDTEIGKFLDTFQGVGVYDYFENHPKIPPGARRNEADKVWRHASRKFIESLWGKVSTSVCGVDRTRIFYTEEIPIMAVGIPTLIHALVKSDDIEIVNDVPMKEIRGVYKTTNYEPAYRLICLAEQRAVRREAFTTGEAEIMDIYLNYQERYRLDRQEMLRGTANDNRPVYQMGPKERLLLKQEKMRQFVAAHLHLLIPTSSLPAIPPSPALTGGHPRLVIGLH